MADIIELKIYIVGGTPHSEQALNQLQAFLARKSVDHFNLHVIDLKNEPMRALIDGVVVVPTLQRVIGKQPARLIGNLSDLAGLGLFLSAIPPSMQTRTGPDSLNIL